MTTEFKPLSTGKTVTAKLRQSCISLCAGVAAVTAIAPSAFGQVRAPNMPQTGYTSDGTLFMGGRMIGNPHQILHDAVNPSLFGVDAVRFTFTDDPTHGQGTLAQMENHTQNLDLPSNLLFTRLYVNPVNPYTSPDAGPFPNYQTYQGVIADAQAGNYQLTVANDNNLYAFKTLSAPNQQARNILIKELPASAAFLAKADPLGGAVGVRVSQTGDSVALQNYFATTKPYDFSWQSAMGPWAAGGQRPNNLANVAGFGISNASAQAEATFYNWMAPQIDVFQDPQGFGFGARPRAYMTDDGVNGVSYSQEGNYAMLAMSGGSAEAYGFTGPDAQRRYQELMGQWASNHNPFYSMSHDGDATQFDLNRYQSQFGEHFYKTMMCEVHSVCRSDWVEFRDDFLRPVVAIGAAVWIAPLAAEAVGDALMMSIPATGAAMSPATIGLISAGAGGFAAGTASTYITTGDIGQSLRAGLRGGFTGAAFYAVGSLTTTTGEAPQSMTGQINPATGQPYIADAVNPITNTIGHATVGCISAAIFGDNGTSAGTRCQQGAAGAGVGAASGHFFGAVGVNDSAGQLVAATIGGGLGSVAAGGSFSEGAITGAFGYLFNECQHTRKCGWGRNDVFSESTVLSDGAGNIVIGGDGLPVLIPENFDLNLLAEAGGLARQANILLQIDLQKFGQGGEWDLQRLTGNFDPRYIDAATIAIGYYCAAAGLSYEQTMAIQNTYALFRSTYGPNTIMDNNYIHLPVRNVTNTRIGMNLFRNKK
jgi:hypothetical protein